MEFLVLMSRRGERHPTSQPTDELATQMQVWMQEQMGHGRVAAVRAFVDGGGLMVVHVDSAEELHDVIQSNPSSAYMRPEVRVLLDFDQSMNGFATYAKDGAAQLAQR
jgi:muconolactone delta-isomerase